MHLIVKNLQLRFKKFSHKMTSQRPVCAHPVLPSNYHLIPRGSGLPSSDCWALGFPRIGLIPHPMDGEAEDPTAWPRFPLHHSSGHHSSPITKKLRKDNLDVFIVLFTNHKAGQKQSVNTGREHRIHSSNSTGAGPGPLCSEGDVVQQNGSYFWEQACPTRNYIHLSTKARIASNCGKAKRTEVAQV